MRSAVVTGKYLPQVFIGKFLRENRTVDCGRVAASFCVHEELGFGDVPRHWTQWFRHELLVWQSGVVDFDLMTTERGAGTTYDNNNHRLHLDGVLNSKKIEDSPSLQLAHEQFFNPSAYTCSVVTQATACGEKSARIVVIAGSTTNGIRNRKAKTARIAVVPMQTEV